jgi:nucleotide-binding universal stress UspA family protein
MWCKTRKRCKLFIRANSREGKMYKKILVPLDGSELAECVLPHLESIVKGCNVPDVILIRVVEPVHLPSGTLTDGGYIYKEAEAKKAREQEDLHNEAVARDYLVQLKERLNIGGAATVRAEVIKGKAAESLADYVDGNGIDLVIIATHGRSGVSRWVMGSVADRMLRSVCVPVLMVRAPGCVPGI